MVRRDGGDEAEAPLTEEERAANWVADALSDDKMGLRAMKKAIEHVFKSSIGTPDRMVVSPGTYEKIWAELKKNTK
jgi:hypothetical protein